MIDHFHEGVPLQRLAEVETGTLYFPCEKCLFLEQNGNISLA
jgi:hypothetical protein